VSRAKLNLARDLVILVGQMGAGKSTVARLLAARWPGFAAVDLDERIEAVAGRPLTDIFATDGEAAFRALEAEVLLAQLAASGKVVLATGGGAACQPGAMERMRSAGRVVWLLAPPKVLAQRALASPRPLLAGLDRTAAERFLAAQLLERRRYYAMAHHTVDASASPEQIASAIDQALSGLLDRLP